jgi:probable lipoprotein NlpC
MRIDDLIGKPFVDGGRGPGGYDCYGVVKEVFRRAGIDLPEYHIGCLDTLAISAAVESQRSLWRRLTSPAAPCVVAIRLNPGSISHVGAYIGGGQFIHAYQNAGGVCINRLEELVWKRRIEGFYAPGWLHD